MDEAQKKLLEQLALAVKNLHDAVSTKFSNANPEAAEAEKTKLANEVKELQEQMKTLRLIKAVSKMAWAVPGKPAGDGVKAIGFGKFLTAIKQNDLGFLAEMKAATGMSEGTDADGGYTVPVEFSNEIIPLIRMASIARRIANIFPMGSKTRTFPRQLTHPTVTWTGEGVNKTLTKITFEQLTQTAKKLAAIVALTDELLEDNAVGLDSYLFQSVADAFGREEDRVAFAGNTGAGDPFMGVLYATGVNDVTMAAGSLSYPDLVDLIFAVPAQYRPGSRFVLPGSLIQLSMKMVDDNNRPVWQPSLSEGQPTRILGYPVEETDVIPSDLGTGDDESAALFGNFGKYLFLSPRGSYKVDASNAATDGTNHAFLKNETWYRFEERLSIDVALPDAFARMQFK